MASLCGVGYVAMAISDCTGTVQKTRAPSVELVRIEIHSTARVSLSAVEVSHKSQVTRKASQSTPYENVIGTDSATSNLQEVTQVLSLHRSERETFETFTVLRQVLAILEV